MKRKYDADFKRNTVQKVLDGQSAASVARELGIGENQIYKWKKVLLQNGNGIRSSTEMTENVVLKKLVRKLETERDILKKAAIIFGRGS